MPRPIGIVIPWYVEIAEATMRDIHELDLWRMHSYHRNRLILAALDAEIAGEARVPQDWVTQSFIEAAVDGEWRRIKIERQERSKGKF